MVSQWLLNRIKPEMQPIKPEMQHIKPAIQPFSRPDIQPCSSREDLSCSESEAEIQIINYVDKAQNLNCGHCSKNFETEESLVEHKNAMSASLLAGFLPPKSEPTSGPEDLSDSETEEEIQIVNQVNNIQNNQFSRQNLLPTSGQEDLSDSETEAEIQNQLMPTSGQDDQSSSETEAEIQIVNSPDNYQNKQPSPQNIPISHICDHCSKNFETEQNLLEHKNSISAFLRSAFF